MSAGVRASANGMVVGVVWCGVSITQCSATLLSHWAGLDLFHAARKVLFIDRAGTNVQVRGREVRGAGGGEGRAVEGRRGAKQ